jgi:hypothetical protein
MASNIVQVPLPEKLEPKMTTRSLMISVRLYFYALYNAADGVFKSFLGSVSNKDAVTKNRTADRVRAVDMIKASAKDDQVIKTAYDGDIIKCMSKIMSDHGQGLKVRREKFHQLTKPAE